MGAEELTIGAAPLVGIGDSATLRSYDDLTIGETEARGVGRLDIGIIESQRCGWLIDNEREGLGATARSDGHLIIATLDLAEVLLIADRDGRRSEGVDILGVGAIDSLALPIVGVSTCATRDSIGYSTILGAIALDIANDNIVDGDIIETLDIDGLLSAATILIGYGDDVGASTEVGAIDGTRNSRVGAEEAG